MKNSHSISKLFTLVLILLASITSSNVALAQGTTSAIRVNVIDANGDAVEGVQVGIQHMPTGRTTTINSNDQGIVTARGIIVGGPYEVFVAAGGQYEANRVLDIFVDLDQTTVVDLPVRSQIEEIVVVAEAMTQEVAVGVGRSFDRAAIDATPSISRDFTATIARDPKILVDNSVARGPAVSMAGQNFRFNSVTIDGVPQNDNFGLNKNASATSRTPISIDAVEAVNVNIAPYDVTYGNFVGGNINIVTKSGSNDWEGSAFYYTTDDKLSGDESDGADIDIANFDEKTIGFTLGGPIIRDKLFFFGNYEKFETTVPANAQPLSAIAGVTQNDIDEVKRILDAEYGGFDPGDFATTDTDEDEKRLLKLDWFLNDDHRAVFTYQYAKTDVLFDDFPTSAALNSNRYNINQEMNAYSAQIFSRWNDKLTTEFKWGVKDVKRRDKSVDSSTNEFLINTAGGGTILAGGDRFRHSNELDNQSDIFKLQADYLLGDHLITAGWERESKSVRNRFLPFSKGLFCFSSVADLESRTIEPFCSTYGNSNTGVATDAEADFTLDNDSFFIQDEWNASDDLTLTFGLRFDTLSNNDPIKENENFEARRGFRNTFNLDGNDLVQPRLGFNWTVNERLTIRGGAGLFGGGAPLIILSNSYAGDGISRTFAFPMAFMDPNAVAAAVADLPDPTSAFRHLQSQIGVDPTASTDAISPDYNILSTWKYSIGAEYMADFSGIGLGDDWQITADYILSRAKDAYDIFEERRVQIDTAPDGRPIYDQPGFGFGWDLTTHNTGLGKGDVVTVGLAKMMDTRAGLFDMALGYTRTNMKEKRSYNRFVTFETLVFDATTDVNNPALAPSRYEVADRVTFTLGWQKQLFGENTTSIGLVYAGRSGRHFSYVFGSNGICAFGGLALADCGAEGDIVGSQLFYVPTGVGDPLISGDPAFLADLDEFISGAKCLKGHRGSIITRNNCETGWTSIISVRFAQEVKVGNSAFDILLDIENLGNLINKNWGRVESYTAPSVVAPANVQIPASGGPYLLTPTASYNPAVGAKSVVPDPEIAALPSVYRIQLGVRFRF